MEIVNLLKFPKKLPIFSKSWLYTIGIFLIGLTLYFSILKIGIPSKVVVNLFAPDLTVFFVIILIFLYFAYRPSGWIGELTSFSATLMLFACQLSAVWRSARDANLFFSYGGLLPRSDAHFYHIGALQLLEGGNLNNIASYRPLSHGILATFLSNSNFSYTLYGLLVGGRWNTVFSDYPDLRNLDVVAQSQKIYDLAFSIIRDNPLALIRGAFRAWREFIGNDFVFSFVNSIKVNFMLQILSIVGMVDSYRKRSTSMGLFMITMLIGVLLSIPFVPPWDAGTRAHAATIPIFALFPALGLHCLITKYQWQPLLKIPQKKKSSKLVLFFAIFLALLTFVGPIVTNFLRQPSQFSQISCPEGTEDAYFRNDPGSFINLVANESITRTNLPNIRLFDFKSGLSQLKPEDSELSPELYQLPANTTIFQKINLKNSRGMNIIVDKKLLPKERGVIAACVQKKSIPILKNSKHVHDLKFYYAQSIKLASSKD